MVTRGGGAAGGWSGEDVGGEAAGGFGGGEGALTRLMEELRAGVGGERIGGADAEDLLESVLDLQPETAGTASLEPSGALEVLTMRADGLPDLRGAGAVDGRRHDDRRAVAGLVLLARHGGCAAAAS